MKDLRGNDIAVGDTIVYAFVSGNMPYLRIGEVMEFVEKRHPWKDGQWIEKMRVEWTEPNGKVWTSLLEHGNRALII